MACRCWRASTPEMTWPESFVRGGVGYAVEGDSITQLQQAAERLADHADALAAMSEAGRRFAERLFSPAVAAKQVVDALASTNTS